MKMPFDNFYYTRMLNEMAKAINTDIIALGDGDVLIPFERIYEGAEMVRSGAFDVVSGYNGHLYNVEAKEYTSEELDTLQDRAIKLGYKYGRVNGPMYHLKHPVTHFKTSKEVKKEMEQEFRKVHAMTKRELVGYISTWPWSKKGKLF